MERTTVLDLHDVADAILRCMGERMITATEKDQGAPLWVKPSASCGGCEKTVYICGKCKKEIDEYDDYCRWCGTKVIRL